MGETIIRIGAGRGGDSYPVELLQWNGHAPVASGYAGTLELTAAELASLQGLLPGSTPAAALQNEGLTLCNKLRAALGQGLDDILNGAAAEICIELPPGELNLVPWEIMVWEKPSIVGTNPVVVAQAHHVSRVFNPDWTAPPLAPQGPLRVLLVIGVIKDPAVEAEEEEQEIRRRLHPAQRTVDVESIQPPSRQDLYSKIKAWRPHVLHFIGHGTSMPPLLRLGGWDWTAPNIAADVGNFNLDQWKPALVFLNACRTASAAGLSGPVAGAFLQADAAAIAMQGNIRGKAAGTLAGVFYGKLGQGVPINRALSYARNVVAQMSGDKEAAYPALTTRRASAVTLPSFREMNDDYRQRVPLCGLLPKLDVFVDQIVPRRDFCRNFWPVLPTDISQRFVVLRGDTGYGKTALSAWMLDLELRMGYAVRYVRIAAERNVGTAGGQVSAGVDYVQALKLVWGVDEQQPGSPLTDPLPRPSEDLLKAFETVGDVAGLCAAFRRELLQAAKERPLTIVIDELRQKMDPGSFWGLWEHLFVPIARGETPNVNLVLVLGEDDYGEYRIDAELDARPELKAPKMEIRLRPLSQQEFIDRFTEYLYFRSDKFRADRVQRLIPGIVEVSTENETQPLSVARFEQKALELARGLSLDIGRLD